MKNKELVTALAARMGWTAQEVTETLSVLSLSLIHICLAAFLKIACLFCVLLKKGNTVRLRQSVS